MVCPAAVALLAACSGDRNPVFGEPEYALMTGDFELVSVDDRAPQAVVLGRDEDAESPTFGHDFVVGRAFLRIFSDRAAPAYRVQICTGWIYDPGLTPLVLTHTDGNAVRMTSTTEFLMQGEGTLLHGTGRGFRRSLQSPADSLTITSSDSARFGTHVWRFHKLGPGAVTSCASAVAADATPTRR